MANVIELVIKTRDQMSGPLGNAEKSVNRFRFSLDQLAGALGIAGGVAGVTYGLKRLVQLGAESQLAVARLDTRLRSTRHAAGMTRAELVDLANALASVTTYSDEAIKGVEDLMLTFTAVGRDIFPQAIETALNMSQVLGQDLKSSVIQLGKALQDPILGATALRRVGVNLSDQQAELIKRMVEVGDVAKAQQLILAELATEFGGAAQDELDTYTGMWKALGKTLGEVAGQVGEGLNKVLERPIRDYVTYLEKVVLPIFNKVRELTSKGWGEPGMEAFLPPLPSEGDAALGVETFADRVIAAITKLRAAKAEEYIKKVAKAVELGEFDTDLGIRGPRTTEQPGTGLFRRMRGFDQLEEMPDILETSITWADELAAALTEVGLSAERVASSIASGIGNAFAQALIYGQNFGQAMENVFKSLLAMVVQLTVQMAVLKGLMSIGLFASGGWTALPALVGGGPATPGWLKGSGPIINHSGGGMGSSMGAVTRGFGGQVVQHFHISAIDAKDVRHEMRYGKLAHEFRRMARTGRGL